LTVLTGGDRTIEIFVSQTAERGTPRKWPDSPDDCNSGAVNAVKDQSQWGSCRVFGGLQALRVIGSRIE
jgi:hypothetical protein